MFVYRKKEYRDSDRCRSSEIRDLLLVPFKSNFWFNSNQRAEVIRQSLQYNFGNKHHTMLPLHFFILQQGWIRKDSALINYNCETESRNLKMDAEACILAILP